MNRALSIGTNLFPIWVLLGGALALVHPSWFTWFSGEFITWRLAVIMLGMGITLSVDDFKAVLKMPRAVAIGFVAHYAIMPFLGWSIAHLLRLETPFAVGLILVSCCPCGTASNVVNYFFSRLLRCDELTSRTISVEVGMQNSGLGRGDAGARTLRHSAVGRVALRDFGDVSFGDRQHSCRRLALAPGAALTFGRIFGVPRFVVPRLRGSGGGL